MALSKNNPTTQKSWKSLEKIYQQENDLKILDYIKNEPNRVEKFSVSLNNFYVDFSKNRISEKALDHLIDLCNETDLKKNINRYFDGEKINETEKRPVLHTALRSNKNKSTIINEEVQNNLEKIEIISNEINSGKRLGYSGKKIENIVNIGIGGSHLGPEMVTEALSHYNLGIKPYFISNIDADYTDGLLKRINPETTIFIIVSKTFNTIETVKNAKKVKSWFIENFCEEAIPNHFIAISNNIEGPKEFGVYSENILAIPEWVGGRFSLWGSVGLIISICIGYKNFESFLGGAREMDEHFRESPFQKNIPVILALISIWYNNFFKCETEAVLPYNQSLRKLPDYLQQANMESNGKSIDRDGNKIKYETGSIIWGSTGTNAQHAFFQLMHQGTKLIPIDFIAFVEPLNEDYEQHKILNSNFLAQINALLVGSKKSGNDIHKNIEGNKPSNSILINKLTPHNLGSLIAMYESKIFAIGSILNIYSFDQWGVELGKSTARDILEGKEDYLDISTKNIANKLTNRK